MLRAPTSGRAAIDLTWIYHVLFSIDTKWIRSLRQILNQPREIYTYSA